MNRRHPSPRLRVLRPLLGLVLLAATMPAAHARPFADGRFTGRIAYSCDGNHNDPDDWIASPITLAILAESGLRDRLVHFDYNSILPLTNPEWERIHEASVLGAAERCGFDRALFFNDRADLDGAVASLVRAINRSSAADPLYLIIAGPMEVPYRAMQRADPAKLCHVFCISHSRWNDGYQSGYRFSFTKRSVIEQGVRWVQIQDQNKRLSLSRYGSPAKPHEFASFFWMRDSRHPAVKFLWERMLVSTRPDPSDAGMTWFLATGDEECTPEKLRQLLEEHRPAQRVDIRPVVRIEAENFRRLDGFVVDEASDRAASHRLSVRANAGPAASLRTIFDEPFAAPRARYDVEVRTFAGKAGAARFTLAVNGVPRGEPWSPAADATGWTSHVIRAVEIAAGDELRIDAEGAAARIDYVQLNIPASGAAVPDAASDGAASPAIAPPRLALPSPTVSATATPGAALDDPAAMPGGLIVAGKNPGYLKYNGGRAVFLCGPDNPEEFLYLGKLNPDGTRSDGGQSAMIARLARTGVNAFHCLVFRMQRCNFKKEGDDTHCPFLDHDPAKPLNPAVLAQWDGWLTEFERAGINVHLEFYNDATDVELMGWKLDAEGNLPADERRFVAGIVDRFKHHRNLLWGIEESCNKLPGARTAHFQKIGELIARTDNHHHPIVASFVIPEDPEGDFPPGGVMSDAYVGDPNIRVVTWLHLRPNGTDYDKQHKEYLRFAQRDRGRFVTMKNETFHHPRRGEQSRRYMWASAMTGLHTLEAYHDATADRTNDDTLRDDARIHQFMSQTDFFAMQSQDELANGSTKWVLVRPGEAYIAYTYDYWGPMGLKNLPAGTYDLLWFDTENGRQVAQRKVTVKGGNVAWTKPDEIGNEPALCVRRATGGDAPTQ